MGSERDGERDEAWLDALLPGAGVAGPTLVEILDHIAHPVFVKDRALRLVFLNTAAEKLLGFPRGEMVGKSDHDFFPRPQADFFREKDLETFRTGQPVVIEEEPLTDAGGALHYLATTKTPLYNAQGEATHLVGIIHDITRLVRAEEALRHANEALEQRVLERTRALEAAQQDLVRQERLAVLGRLAGGVAHQIRNPLASIANASAILRRAAPGSDEFREALDILREESSRANRIVTDLVSYARVRAPTRRRVPMERAIREVLAASAPPDDVRVELALLDTPDAFVDELQVHEALGNLVRNAIEAMPQGGTLRVALQPGDGELLRVVIEDDGVGIPELVQASMFEPLLTTKPMGLGLGLVTAQSLVASQGGHITWSSPSVPGGRGARFEVWLPKVDEVEVPRGAPPPAMLAVAPRTC